MNEQPPVTNWCDLVQELLVDRGVGAIRQQPDAHAHLGGCDECYGVMLSLQELDVHFATMPALEPPQTLLEATLALVQSEQGIELPAGLTSQQAHQSAAESEAATSASQSDLSAARVPMDLAQGAASGAAAQVKTGAVRAGRRTRPHADRAASPQRWLTFAVQLLKRTGSRLIRGFENLAEHKTAFRVVMAGLAAMLMVPSLYLFTNTGAEYGGDDTHANVANVATAEESTGILERDSLAQLSDRTLLGPEVSNPDRPERWGQPMGGEASNMAWVDNDRRIDIEQEGAGDDFQARVGDAALGGRGAGFGGGGSLEAAPRSGLEAPDAVSAFQQGRGEELRRQMAEEAAAAEREYRSAAREQQERDEGEEAEPFAHNRDDRPRGLRVPADPAPPVESAQPTPPYYHGYYDYNGDVRDAPEEPSPEPDAEPEPELLPEDIQMIRVAETSSSSTESDFGIEAGRYNVDLPSLDESGSFGRTRNLDDGRDWAQNGETGLMGAEDEERPPIFEPRQFVGDLDGSGGFGLNFQGLEGPLALAFLQQRRSLLDLVYQSPRGYWANTYVPGDPVLRDLQHRLTAAAEIGEVGLEMARQSDAVSQPFDAPDNSALAVYLHADQTGANQETRMLLQVGLQGTQRQAGRRPTMNIGVVLDLRGALSSTDAAHIRALLEAMTEAHDIGDRFSLIIAGREGGQMIVADEFRYGTVRAALNQLFTGDVFDEPLGEVGVNYTITEAVRAAHNIVFADDDPTAPLGSSLVLLVTPSRLGGEVAVIQQLAHDSAVNGVPTSVVGVGNNIDLTELDAVALSGQGNRRLLGENDDAEDLLARELAAASRVVARAVRLRIRLAPGVQLVDVLGSYRLDEVQSERVREAEVAIDQRLSRNLGITSDRGEDEDGIQIVIPAYYADDSHVILLDVVVPGPGPIADVTVRYKDLVHLRNGVARANLTLGRDASAPGPLEQNVTKNLVAYELSQLLQDTAIQVRRGFSPDLTVTNLEAFAAMLRGLRSEIPGWQTDPEIERDLSLLSHYMDALEYDTMLPVDIADSLLYASYLKLLPEPQVEAP